MIEIGETIGCGYQSFYFRIKNRYNLGIKIPFIGSKWSHKRYLKTELRRGKFLRSIGVSVPRYIGLAIVRLPRNIVEVISNSNAARQSGMHSEYVKRALQLKPGFCFGLVIEHVEDNARIIPMETKKALFEKELAKMRKYGIRPTDANHLFNVLYSERLGFGKIYLIDFEIWIWPDELGL